MKQQLTYTDKKGLERLAYVPKKNPLPTRERQVLILSIQKLTAGQTAEALGISIDTVYNTRKKTFKRLKCNNTEQAVIIAIKKGYIESD